MYHIKYSIQNRQIEIFFCETKFIFRFSDLTDSEKLDFRNRLDSDDRASAENQPAGKRIPLFIQEVEDELEDGEEREDESF